MNDGLRDAIAIYEQEDSEVQSMRGQAVFDWMLDLLLPTEE